MSACKSMTVRFFIHSVAKRAKATALLDSGATENFMNLSYAKWLKLPIKELAQPRKLFNVDNTENVSGELKHYTDLQVQTRSKVTKLRFFLMHIGEQKAILGYPWFAANQPKIDWKQGWIDHTQLPSSSEPTMQSEPSSPHDGRIYRDPPIVTDTSSEASRSILSRRKPHKRVSQMNTSDIKKYSTSKNPKDYPTILYGTMRSNFCQMPPSHSQDNCFLLRRRK